jgi:hypothetical protein
MADDELPRNTPNHQRPGRLSVAIRWFGRLYVGFAALEAIGVVVALSTGHFVLAVRGAASVVAWLLVGGVIIGASHLELPGYNSPEMVRSRELSKGAFRGSHLRWLFGLIFAIQLGAMGFIAYLIFRHR